MATRTVSKAPVREPETPGELSREPVRDQLLDGPYKGLSYYEEVDAPFFFGRERETQIVVAKLRSSRLTVLYGQSGVGKSSLLRAGAARELMEIARENVERRGTPRLVVAVFPFDDELARATWRDDPIGGIMKAVQRAVESLQLDVAPPDAGTDLCKGLAEWNARLGSDLVVVLDQFEEYLLYHEGEDGPGTLAAELPRALSEPNLRVNFLISIREDMLAKLDSFKRSIPTIFDTCVSVGHLSQQDARAAIEKPIKRYNELPGSTEGINIEPKLVDALLRELETGRVVVGVTGVGEAQERSPGEAQPVETPYLQLVMTRLWREERQAGSKTLRLATLDRLGHAERIVKTHLDATMHTLPRYARYVAARTFRHLVTPSGSKIAHRATDLAAYTGLGVHEIEPVLERLTEPGYRILRPVASSTDTAAAPRFEIFHDVLGAPILDWLSRYLRTRETLEAVRSGFTMFVLIAFGLGWLYFLLYKVFVGDYESGVSRGQALWIAWASCGLLIWLSTTIVLVKRRQRREAWAVPLVGIVAAAIGPVAALISVVGGVVYLASLAARRGTAHERRRGDGRSSDDASGARLMRFGALVSVIGAGVIVLACWLPAAHADRHQTHCKYNYGGCVDYDSSSSLGLLSSGDIMWFALLPLLLAAIAGLIGLLALVRPRPRLFVLGLLSGLGIGALTYFFSLLWWDEALLPYAKLTPFHVFRGGVNYSYTDYSAAYLAAFLGIAGVGLVLVAAAPAAALDIFASIVGVGRVVGGTPRVAPQMNPNRARWALVIPLCALGAAALIAGLTAAAIPSGAWHRDRSVSLFGVSFWAGLPVLVPAVAAGAAVVAVLFGRRVGERAAGCLTGCGLVFLTLFIGVIGTRHGDAPFGAYLGFGAGAVLVLVGLVGFVVTRRGGSARPPRLGLQPVRRGLRPRDQGDEAGRSAREHALRFRSVFRLAGDHPP
jgi:hypothetical protein